MFSLAFVMLQNNQHLSNPPNLFPQSKYYKLVYSNVKTMITSQQLFFKVLEINSTISVLPQQGGFCTAHEPSLSLINFRISKDQSRFRKL